MAPNKPQQLEERIREIQAEANAFIDAKAADLKKQFPGLPERALRQDIEKAAWGCPCKQALSLTEAK